MDSEKLEVSQLISALEPSLIDSPLAHQQTPEETLSSGDLTRQLFLLSILILFLELFIVRWVSTEINIFAYLQNIIVVICFMGLSMGSMRGRAPLSLYESLKPFSVLAACLSLPKLREYFRMISRMLGSLHDFTIWTRGDAQDAATSAFEVAAGLLSTLFIMWLIWNIFLPLGTQLGNIFDRYSGVLRGYSINIAGSLIGLWLFVLLTAFSLSPPYWFGMTVILYIPLLAENKKQSFGFLAVIFLLGLAGRLTDQKLLTLWSPYQKLSLESSPLIAASGEPLERHFIEVNNSGYQVIVNDSPKILDRFPDLYPPERRGLNQYDLPFLLHPNSREVLILGSGTGNNVAGALRNNAKNITAVEIDPAIIELGRKYHPEHPYDASNVQIVTDDARAFFMKTEKKYDLIIFGLLDSHTTPSMTNARLDHYVYTTESMRLVRNLLTPDGVAIVFFVPLRPFIIDRLATILRDTFEKPPLVFGVPGSHEGTVAVGLVSGNLQTISDAVGKDSRLSSFLDEGKAYVADWLQYKTKPTTDNWPFLYLDYPRIPILFPLICIALAALFYTASRRLQIPLRPNSLPLAEFLHFAALGAGFMLLEVHNISKSALLFGSTWVVNAIVISGILLMVLASNWAVLSNHSPKRLTAAFGLLSACAFLYFFDLATLNRLEFGLKLVLGALLTSLPIFFSGIIFARSFSKTNDRHEALGANLFGSVAGGILQLLSYCFGMRMLLGFVFAFYLFAVSIEPLALKYRR